MRKLSKLLLALSFVVSITSSAFAVTVVSWGGAYTESQKLGYGDPTAAKLGIPVDWVDYGGGLSEIKAQKEAGAITWDIIDVYAKDTIIGCDEGIFVEFDFDKDFSPAPDGTPRRSSMLKHGNFRTDRREFLQQVGAVGALTVLRPATARATQLTSTSDSPDPIHWQRYGYDLQNTRFNPLEKTLGENNVSRLQVKWQFDLDMPIETTPAVVGNLLFDRGIPGTYEVTEMLIVIMTFVGVGYAARCARHISMSAIYDTLSGAPRKALLILISLGTGALMFYFAYKSAQYDLQIFDRGRVSSSVGIPLWMVYLALPIGFSLAGLQYLLTIVRNLASPGTWRSFREREGYADVPDSGDATDGGLS